jgi:hypothetical protein
MKDIRVKHPEVLKILIGILLILLCITPVSSSTIDLTVTGSIDDLTLAPGHTSTAPATLTIVSTDSDSWTIKARDAMADTGDLKPSGSEGRFAEFNTTSEKYITDEPKIIGTPMRINGTETSSIARTDITALTASDQTLETGSAIVTTPQELPITFSQVVTYTDTHLTNDHEYRITVVFTGTTY